MSIPTRDGLDADCSAMHLDDTLGNRKAEARAALLPRAAVVDLLEFLENAGLMFGRDAGTGIAHHDFEMPVPGAGGNVDRSGFSELDGIAGQIEENLGQAALIAASERQSLGDSRCQLQTFCPRQGLGCGRDRPDDLADSIVIELKVSWPASIFERSSTSLMRPSR